MHKALVSCLAMSFAVGCKSTSEPRATVKDVGEPSPTATPTEYTINAGEFSLTSKDDTPIKDASVDLEVEYEQRRVFSQTWELSSVKGKIFGLTNEQGKFLLRNGQFSAGSEDRRTRVRRVTVKISGLLTLCPNGTQGSTFLESDGASFELYKNRQFVSLSRDGDRGLRRRSMTATPSEPCLVEVSLPQPQSNINLSCVSGIDQSEINTLIQDARRSCN